MCRPSLILISVRLQPCSGIYTGAQSVFMAKKDSKTVHRFGNMSKQALFWIYFVFF